MVYISFNAGEHPYNHYLNSISDKLFLFISFISFLEFFLALFLLGFIYFSLNFGCFFVFISMYYIDLLWFLVFVRLLYVVGVLWGPVVQFPWSPDLGAPGMSLVSVLWALLPDVFGSLVLLNHLCLWLTLRMVELRLRLSPEYGVQVTVQVMTTQRRNHLDSV